VHKKFFTARNKCGKMDKVIIANGLTKSYSSEKILSNLTFTINRGEIVAIFGPNGCGKSTILDILSGLKEKTSGELNIKDFDTKRFSYIFQNYRETLLPWKNNYENLILPLRFKKATEDEINNKVEEMDKIFNFSPNYHLYPYQLSGGQQQILTFMRALITKPELLFIDEPFSSLDYEHNLLLRKHLQEYYKKYNPTIIAITHNIEEAVHLASKIIVLSNKPTKITSIIQNINPYPRDWNYLESKSFSKITKKVLEAFEEGIQ
jgi:NitT/TauT family transport system ATP-binding protein